MTDPQLQSTGKGGVSAEDIRAVKFNRVLGRGYEQQEVDAFVDKCAAWIDWFDQQLRGAQRDLAMLGQQIADDGAQVQQAVQVLTNAQQTADTTVRQADQYSLRVMSEAKQLYEDARLRTASLEQEAEVRAKGLTEDVSLRAEQLQRDSTQQADELLRSTREQAAVLEREARARAEQLVHDAAEKAAELDAETQIRLQELGETTATTQAELDRQTAYLRTLRDSSRIQMQKFLEGMLDHLSDEYGRADPAAAEAAADGKPAAAPAAADGKPAATATAADGKLAATANSGATASRRLVGRPKRSTRRTYRPVPAAHVPLNAAVPQQRAAEES